jgi:beta-lactam-binding protein with PASTA domain
MKNIITFLKSKKFLINLAASFVFVFLFFGLVYKWLDIYTDHNNTITVPDVHGMKLAEAQSFLHSKNLEIKIADSSVYDLKKPPGTIIEQDPAVNEKVKQGRTIYLTITRTIAPLVKLPDLKDVSLRQAEAILESYGLILGQQIYKPDLAKNAVLEVLSNNEILREGDEVRRGTVIDLVLGDGLGNTRVPVPLLVDLTVEEAMFVLKGSSLNVGSILSEGPVTDTLTAKVYKQTPSAGDSSFISQGEAVDLFIKQ